MDKILKSQLRELNIFDYDKIQQLGEAHQRGEKNHAVGLWAIFNLSLWYDYWIKNDKSII